MTMSTGGHINRGRSSEEKMGLLDEDPGCHSDSEASFSDFESLRNNVKNTIAPYSKYTSVFTKIFMAIWTQLSSAPWRMTLSRILAFLVPSFLQGKQAWEQICPDQLPPTAYLDGMRGTAALMVFFCHYFYQSFVIATSWGTEEDNYALLKLPILRLWYQGPAAVCVFFVISGYALSYRPLKLARKGTFGEFATTMSSLTFRRGIRLYLPPAISTMMTVIMLQMGILELTRDFSEDRDYMKNIVEGAPPMLPTMRMQLHDWAVNMYDFVHVWDWSKFGGATHYDVHLWTIPVEFRCSLYLFLTLIGTARLRTSIRILVVSGILWFAYNHSRFEFCLFLGGMLIAETDHIRGAHVAQPELPLSEKQHYETESPRKRIVWGLISLVGLYLLSQPDVKGELAPGWRYLTSLIPLWWREEQYRYYQSIGAIIFVCSVGHLQFWKRFFESPPIQYLGKISYALYLMHGPAMHTIGLMWEELAWDITGIEGYWYNVGFVLGSFFCIPTVIWWSDIFWRAVDIPTVKFAKWVEKMCTSKK